MSRCVDGVHSETNAGFVFTVAAEHWTCADLSVEAGKPRITRHCVLFPRNATFSLPVASLSASTLAHQKPSLKQ